MAEQTTTVRVLRPFLYKGKPTKVDDVLTVPARVAGELVQMNKAERIAAPAAKPATPKVEAKAEVK